MDIYLTNTDARDIYFTSASVVYKYMSNMYRQDFHVEDVLFHSVEQYFQYQKAVYFKDTKTAALLLKECDPYKCKRLGKNVRPFKARKWNKVSVEIMYKGLYNKFSQNSDLKKKLLETENRKLIEESIYDTKWGSGWTRSKCVIRGGFPGENLMGETLMRVRKALAQGKTVCEDSD